MFRTVRKILRNFLPGFVRVPLRYLETYVKRLNIWFSISRNVRGVAARDRASLRKSLLAAPVTAASSLSTWRDPVMFDDAQVQVKDVGKFHIRAQSDDLWHVLPSREPAIVEAVHTMLGPGDIFVDAGANVGFYSILASRLVGPTGRVVAVEMMPDTASILRQNIDLNGLTNVTLIEKALSDTDGDLVTANVIAGKFGRATISGGQQGGQAIEVATTTLDRVLNGYPSMRAMKMDLEGVEELALKGAQDVLKRIDALIFECWTVKSEVAEFLAARGFSVRALDRRNNIATRS